MSAYAGGGAVVPVLASFGLVMPEERDENNHIILTCERLDIASESATAIREASSSSSSSLTFDSPSTSAEPARTSGFAQFQLPSDYGIIHFSACAFRHGLFVLPTQNPHHVIVGTLDEYTYEFREMQLIPLDYEPRCADFNDDATEFAVISAPG